MELSGKQCRCLGQAQLIDQSTGNFECRRSNGDDPAAAYRAGQCGNGNRRLQSRVATDCGVVEYGRIVIDSVRDSETTANRRLARLKRIPGKTEVRRPVVQVLGEEFSPSALARKVQDRIGIVKDRQ